MEVDFKFSERRGYNVAAIHTSAVCEQHLRKDSLARPWAKRHGIRMGGNGSPPRARRAYSAGRQPRRWRQTSKSRAREGEGRIRIKKLKPETVASVRSTGRSVRATRVSRIERLARGGRRRTGSSASEPSAARSYDGRPYGRTHARGSCGRPSSRSEIAVGVRISLRFVAPRFPATCASFAR